MSISSLMSDEISVCDSAGVARKWKASVQGDTVFVADKQADFQEGQVIERRLPNQRVEQFHITEASFLGGPRDHLAHWELKVERLDAKGQPVSRRSDKQPASSVIISNSSNVQVGNGNTMALQSALADIITAVDKAASPAERTEVRNRLSAFMSHPAVIAVIGAVSGELARRISGQ